MKKLALLLIVVAVCMLAAENVMAQRGGGRSGGHRGGGRNGGRNRSDARSGQRTYKQSPPRVAPKSFVPQSTRSLPSQWVLPPNTARTKSAIKKSLGYRPGYKYVRPVHPIYQPPRYRHRHYYYGWEPRWWVFPSTVGVGYVWWNWNTPDTYVYYNPYGVYVRSLPYNYTAPVVIVQEPQAAPNNLNPNQAVPAPEPVPAVEVPEAIAAPQPVEKPIEGPEIIAAPKPVENMKHFQTAQENFRKGNYNATTKALEQAITKAPEDATLHEFLGLTFFAQGKYNEAAGVINAVIASGPGWDWDTMINLYADPEEYTKQLRSLESHVRQNPVDPAARFLLAYHYLVMDFVDNAEKQLKVVVQLQPKDVLSKRLLEMLEKSKKASETPARPTPQG